MTERTDLHQQIAVVLSDGPMNIAEIAQRLGRAYWGVRAALIGMRNRGEVREIPAKQQGVPYSYRLARELS